MDVVDIAKKKVDNALNGIFTSKAYPSFLTFASNFTGFSCSNIILLYLQDPEAKYIAGKGAWMKCFSRSVKPGATPLLVLYPQIKDDSVCYTIQKLFDYRSLTEEITESNIIKSVGKCGKSHLYSALKSYIETREKTQVYQVPDDNIEGNIQLDCEAIIVKESLSTEEKFTEVLDLFLSTKIAEYEYSDMLKGVICSTVSYVVKSYFGLDVSRLSFPFMGIVKEREDRLCVLNESFRLSEMIIRYLNAAYVENGKSRKEMIR